MLKWQLANVVGWSYEKFTQLVMIEHDSSNQNQENTDIKETVTSVTRLFLECTGNEKSYILCVAYHIDVYNHLV